MNAIVPFDQFKSIQVKNENDLPPHITFDQFKIIYDNIKGLDQILWGLLWETGGRITAVLSIRWKDFDINAKLLKLLVQKKKNYTTIKIPLSNAVINDLRNYMLYVKPESEDFIFKTELYNRETSKMGRLTRQGAYYKIRGWGKKHLGFKIHPHMLRHGLAIYLLSQGTPIAVISRRLGHSNVFITSNSYLVITPEVDRQLTSHIPMR
jgi:integrase/recombinase XerD